MDDDLEGLFQCTPCVQSLGRLDTRLTQLPQGSLQLLVEDALQRMKKSGGLSSRGHCKPGDFVAKNWGVS